MKQENIRPPADVSPLRNIRIAHETVLHHQNSSHAHNLSVPTLKPIVRSLGGACGVSKVIELIDTEPREEGVGPSD
jgi:hypothetical protein